MRIIECVAFFFIDSEMSLPFCIYIMSRHYAAARSYTRYRRSSVNFSSVDVYSKRPSVVELAFIRLGFWIQSSQDEVLCSPFVSCSDGVVRRWQAFVAIAGACEDALFSF